MAMSLNFTSLDYRTEKLYDYKIAETRKKVIEALHCRKSKFGKERNEQVSTSFY